MTGKLESEGSETGTRTEKQKGGGRLRWGDEIRDNRQKEEWSDRSGNVGGTENICRRNG